MLAAPNPRHYAAEHEAFRATVHHFVEREILPHATDWDEAGAFPASCSPRRPRPACWRGTSLRTTAARPAITRGA
jgi:alkylation response protein AidB-like acyl-CoA dehydrogenase